MAHWFDVGMSMMGGLFTSNTNVKYEVFDGTSGVTQAKKTNPENISTVYMCAKILSGTVGMMPILVQNDGRVDKEHRLYYQLRHRMSELMNNQAMMSTIEYQRNIYGNSFVDKRKKKLKLIPIEVVDNWDYKGDGGTLRYHLNWGLETEATIRRNGTRKAEWVASKDIIHFKGMSTNGVMGLPPVTAAMRNLNILDNATETIINFYKNRAVTPMSLESTIDSAAGAKVTLEQLDRFNTKYGGVLNSGKTVQLPPNTKLTPIQLQFADAELVATMQFTRDEIANMYGIPSFLVNSTDNVQMDIEQQTLSFKQFTIAPIINMYASELEYKLLTKEEVIGGDSIKLDTSVLIETDLMTMANAYGKFIQNGLISPNQASKKLGFEESDAEAADYRFVQQQLMPLDLFEMHPAFQSMDTGGDKNKSIEDKEVEDKAKEEADEGKKKK
jgi:HK97 family phage portal protein